VTSTQLLEYAQRLQAIAQAGIAYHGNPYDLERYQELRTLSAKTLEELTDEPFEKDCPRVCLGNRISDAES
jgi:hypothetical protein